MFQWFSPASAAVIASLAVAGGLACPGVAAAAPALAGGGPAGGADQVPSASQSVLLVNGDRLLTGPGDAHSPGRLVPVAGGMLFARRDLS